jgi:hypothetical protein
VAVVRKVAVMEAHCCRCERDTMRELAFDGETLVGRCWTCGFYGTIREHLHLLPMWERCVEAQR